MTNPLLTALYQTTASTFEDMGFILPTHEIDENQQQAKRTISVCIDFHGTQEGMFIIHTFGKWLPFLAANMMGEENSPSEKLQKDAIGEIANIICGNILQELAQPDDDFRLDSPRFLDLKDVAAVERLTPKVQAHMGVEDGRITVDLYITQGSLM
jgi:CheY-specific phosphatase CheX